MTMPRSLLPLAVILAAVLSSPGSVRATNGKDYGEVMHEESFPAPASGTVRIDIADGDVELLEGMADRIDVTFYLKARRMERARERYEDMDLRASAESDGVLITSDEGHHWFSGLRDLGGFQVTVLVRLPGQYNVDVETSDGDVHLERLVGKAELVTSDGDVKVDRLEGPLNVETSDGDVSLLEIIGAVDVVTSDGDISVRDARGPAALFKTSDGDIEAETISAEEIDLHTSDGDVHANHLEGRDILVHTSDGDIDLASVSGALQAVTGDGDIFIGITRLDETRIEAGGGDIEITADSRIAADIELRGESVRLGRAADLDGQVSRRRAEGTLNGGGPRLVAFTGDGAVSLRLRGEG